ncbi:MAG TPA: hypothetical protein VKF84_11420 [Candidatus Sulfotelmatobacter sp.]|nr:hypothetical protein [Candidatus Sulfotelmatobacter sp.]
MKIKLDIPDKIHSRLKKKANQKGATVNDLILRAIEAMLTEGAKPRPRRKLPIIESNRPGSLHLDNAKIYEIIDFP